MKQRASIIFISRLYFPHIGGVEKHVAQLSQVLLRKGYDVTVLTEQYEKSLKRDEVVDGVRIVRVPIGKNVSMKKFAIWKWVIGNLSFLFSFDVIHVHDVFFWLLPVRVLFFWKKVYVTFHGYEDYPVKKRWIFMRKVTEKLTNGSICIGKFMKKWYFASPTYVNYGGARLKYKNMRENPFGAVFFGRLETQTGIMQYLDAYIKIKEKYPKFQLTVVGEGPLKKNLPKDVIYKPFTKNVESYIAKNRFIFVSRYLSMIEALGMGKTVVAAYDNPIKKDYLLMSPFKKYVKVFSKPNEIADFVIKNMEKKSLLEIRSEGARWAQAQTWEKVASVYEDLWRR